MEYEWRRRHPIVQHIMANTDEPMRKRTGSTLTFKAENQNKKSRITVQDRDTFMESLCHEFDEELDNLDESVLEEKREGC